MTAQELRRLFLDFFESKGHKIIPSTSLIPENDPTVLFTTAGMHPLVPYLLGEKHPSGRRLADVQKCIRTSDIDEVGDAWHLTFFEMLGNWSLGDPEKPDGIGAGYWKKETIEWSFEFLTDKKYLGLAPEKLSVTVFKGDKDAPKDEESAQIWQKLGVSEGRIFYLPKEDNWWGPAGQTGPCGPCTEIFYDTGKEKCGEKCQPGCSCGKYAEIWNDVFMEYNKTADGKFEPLKQKDVDTGMGVERTIAALNGFDNVYGSELFEPIIKKIEKLSEKKYGKSQEVTHAMRIIADHIKAAAFILAENIEPSNVEQGYVLRRLIRRAVRYGKQVGINEIFTFKVAQVVIDMYKDVFLELYKSREFIEEQLVREEEKFGKVIQDGLKKAAKIIDYKKPITEEIYFRIMQLSVKDKEEAFRKLYRDKKTNNFSDIFKIPVTKEEIFNATITGREAFDLYQTYGFPIEMIVELAQERKLFVDIEDFQEKIQKHQQLSRAGAEQKFKGGLADHSEQVVKYHTTAHLMLAALRQVLGNHIVQRGSNITAERLRFDFSHPKKLTPEEIKKTEDLVNQKIQENLAVKTEEMSLEGAKKQGAMGIFDKRYGDKVKVYTIGEDDKIFSKEICGGPHVEKTGGLGRFKIQKEEAVGAGVRRIKAVLE